MSTYNSKYKEFSVSLEGQSEDVARIRITKTKQELWVPWSVIEDNGENFKNGYKGFMYIAEWWCVKNKLKN